jgi:hypothetical protein
MRNKDGTVHFSELKRMALSPAHYAAAIKYGVEVTALMRAGSLTDCLLLTGEKPIVFNGRRQGGEWELFRSAHAGHDIYTRSEYEDAMEVVSFVRADPLAREFLGLNDELRRTQVPLKWQTNGVPRSTRGIDVLTRRRLVDLKYTNSTKPSLFAWHAHNMLWHAQLADYQEACEQNGIDISEGIFLVGIESKLPYCVTVLKLTEEALEQGRKCIALWIEKFKSCERDKVWPGYTRVVEELDARQYNSDDGEY